MCLNYRLLTRPVYVSPKPQNISSTGQNRLSVIILPLLHGVYEKIYFTSSRGRSDDVTSEGFVSTGLSFRFTKRAQFLTFSIYCKSTFSQHW